MKLAHICKSVTIKKLVGSLDKTISKIVFDSRQADSNSLFVAIEGSATDGHSFIQQVLNQGCTAIIVQKPIEITENCTIIEVENTSEALALASAEFYANPSRELKLIGITGTNGKTTTATLLYNAFSALGYACGLISTVVNKIGKKDIPSTHTTPDPIQLNKL